MGWSRARPVLVHYQCRVVPALCAGVSAHTLHYVRIVLALTLNLPWCVGLHTIHEQGAAAAQDLKEADGGSGLFQRLPAPTT